MSTVSETLSATKAAIAAGVSIADVNHVVDRKIRRFAIAFSQLIFAAFINGLPEQQLSTAADVQTVSCAIDE